MWLLTGRLTPRLDASVSVFETGFSNAAAAAPLARARVHSVFGSPPLSSRGQPQLPAGVHESPVIRGGGAGLMAVTPLALMPAPLTPVLDVESEPATEVEAFHSEQRSVIDEIVVAILFVLEEVVEQVCFSLSLFLLLLTTRPGGT
jgi:hypothetical protein